jgi:hypothetical protein
MYPDGALDPGGGHAASRDCGPAYMPDRVTPQSLVQLAAALLSENSAQAVEPGWIRRPALRSPSPTEMPTMTLIPADAKVAASVIETTATAALSGLQRPSLNPACSVLDQLLVERVHVLKWLTTRTVCTEPVAISFKSVIIGPADPRLPSFRSLLM